MKKANTQKKLRSQRAALLATSEMMIIIPVAVMLLFVLIDTAVLACCKLKLGAVVEESAKFVADLDNDRDIDKEATKYVDGLLKASGQPVKSLKVKVRKFEINDAAAISLTVEGNYPLVQNNFLPAEITLGETAAALVPARKICGYVAISLTPMPIRKTSSARLSTARLCDPTASCRFGLFPTRRQSALQSGAFDPAPKLENIKAQKQDSYFNGLQSIY